MIVYWRYSKSRFCPGWFVEFGRDLTGIQEKVFHQYGWSHLLCVVVLMLVPLALARLDGFSLRDLGLGVKDAHKELLLCVGLWLAFLPVIWFFSDTPGFQATYPRMREANTDPMVFAAFHGYYIVKWISWEFFFRGFMLFTLKKDMGNRAVLLSTVPFVLMHYGKPMGEFYGAVFAGFILCWIALRSKSIWPGVFLHWVVATSMELFASDWFRAIWE